MVNAQAVLFFRSFLDNLKPKQNTSRSNDYVVTLHTSLRVLV